MNYQELIKSNIDANVYLLKGDAFLCQQAKKQIVEKLKVTNIGISLFTDENFDVNNLLNACNQFSFFDEKRVVIVQDLTKELSQDNKTRIINYSKAPNTNCVLVLIDTISSGVFDFLKDVAVVECKTSELFVVDYISKQFKDNNKQIAIDVCKKINEYCLGDLNRINLEIKKICDYLLDQTEVTDQVVDLLVAKETELKVFELTDALGKKDYNKSIKCLNEMLVAGEPPIKILSLIAGTFRRMLFAKINKGTNAELAKALNVKEYAITKAKQMSAFFSASQLKNILSLLLEADYSIKSGQMTQENVLFFVVAKIVG